MKTVIKTLLVGFVLSFTFSNILLAQSGLETKMPKDAIPARDPVMAKEGDTYYVFLTGRGIKILSSHDLMSWKEEGKVFEETPAWINETIVDFSGGMWAPDVIFHNGKYHVFYTASAFGKITSVIGHAENVTLNPNDPRYKWEDKGKIVQSVLGRDLWNAIDPNIAIDKNGTPWLAFGSCWSGIKMVKLKDDLSAIAEPEEWISLARRPRPFEIQDEDPGPTPIEAPFIFKKNDWYYLFVSFDHCCKGAESTYKVVVGRSKNFKGPYLDKDGVSLYMNGGTIVVKGDGKTWAAAGHNSVYTFDGKDYMLFHGYNMDDRALLVIREVGWDADGWPFVIL